MNKERQQTTLIKPEPIRASKLGLPKTPHNVPSAKRERSPNTNTARLLSGAPKRKAGKDQLPLDLSKKPRSESNSPSSSNNIPDRKGPGEIRPPMHQAFPFPDDPTVLNSLMMLNPALREKMIQDAAKVKQLKCYLMSK